MSTRFAGLSTLLVITVFMPWFSVNALIMKISFPAYKLGAIGVLIVVLGVIGILCSQVKQIRFRGLLEVTIGILTLLFIFLSDYIFHNRMTNMLNQFVGGNDFKGSEEVSQAIGSTGFGFYIALIVALLLVGFGLQIVLARKAERLLPEKWDAELFKTNIQQMRGTVAETASSIEAQVKKQDWSWIQNWSWKTTRGKSIVGTLGLVLVYIIALVWYNNAHSLYHTTNTFLNAVTNKDTSSVQKIVSTSSQKLSPGAVNGFVDYYSTHPDDLRNLLSGLSTKQNGDSGDLASLLDSKATDVHSKKSNILGFVSYKIVLPTAEVNLTGPTGSSFAIGKQQVTMPAYVLPGVYTISDTIKGPFGPVTASKSEDTTSNQQINDQFDFSANMLNVTSDSSGKANLTINNVTQPVSFDSQMFGPNLAKVGPVQVQNGDTISAVITMPWGDWKETGQIQDGQCNLQTGSTDNSGTLKDISKLIDQFNVASTTDSNKGTYNDPTALAILVPDSPSYQEFKNQSGTQTFKYNKMELSPDMKIVQLSDGNPGIEVNDSEYYTHADGSQYEVDWTYDMEYSSKNSTWQIQNNSHSWKSISPTTTGVIEFTH